MNNEDKKIKLIGSINIILQLPSNYLKDKNILLHLSILRNMNFVNKLMIVNNLTENKYIDEIRSLPSKNKSIKDVFFKNDVEITNFEFNNENTLLIYEYNMKDLLLNRLKKNIDIKNLGMITYNDNIINNIKELEFILYGLQTCFRNRKNEISKYDDILDKMVNTDELLFSILTKNIAKDRKLFTLMKNIISNTRKKKNFNLQLLNDIKQSKNNVESINVKTKSIKKKIKNYDLQILLNYTGMDDKKMILEKHEYFNSIKNYNIIFSFHNLQSLKIINLILFSNVNEPNEFIINKYLLNIKNAKPLSSIPIKIQKQQLENKAGILEINNKSNKDKHEINMQGKIEYLHSINKTLNEYKRDLHKLNQNKKLTNYFKRNKLTKKIKKRKQELETKYQTELQDPTLNDIKDTSTNTQTKPANFKFKNTMKALLTLNQEYNNMNNIKLLKPTSAKPTSAKPTSAKPTSAKSTSAKSTSSKPTSVKPTSVKPTIRLSNRTYSRGSNIGDNKVNSRTNSRTNNRTNSRTTSRTTSRHI